ncbi:MAG TPA: D-2-hydroxyacid dehydrogenase [Chitinophagaceae bacterium]|nr:D-2-hydroxyacid dehydrogenase [Chitinophagaceae bacterium]
MKIVVLDGYTLNPGDLNWDQFKQLGDFEVYDRTPPDKLIERIKETTAVLTNKVALPKNIISQLPGLKYIGVLATGFNVIDLEAASTAGIVVSNVPAYGTASVSQLTFSLLLHMVQNVSEHAASVKAGQWSGNPDFSYQITPQIELAGKTLGIIGFGQIGQSVARIGRAFEMNIIFYNPSRKKEVHDARQVELDELLSESDVISINCPLTEKNIGFINKTTLQKMKPSAFLINTSRGQLINEKDLAEALNNEWIAGAGIDVLSVEPPPLDNPLITAKNCHITPHIAWATAEARTRLMKASYENLVAFINGKPQNVVNALK